MHDDRMGNNKVIEMDRALRGMDGWSDGKADVEDGWGDEEVGWMVRREGERMDGWMDGEDVAFNQVSLWDKC